MSDSTSKSKSSAGEMVGDLFRHEGARIEVRLIADLCRPMAEEKAAGKV
jgi:hypothetical protein